MTTGRDIAEFVSQMTGDNFVGLYDASAEEEEKMMEQKEKFTNSFKTFMHRINEIHKKYENDKIN